MQRSWIPCALVSALLVGCGDSGNVFVEPPPVPVTVREARLEHIAPMRAYPGRVEPIETIQIRARVSGFLTERRFEAGDLVDAGEVLFIIEQEPFIAGVKAAEAALADAEAARDLAQVTRDRTRQAFERSAVNELEVARVEAEFKRAEAGVLQAQAALETAQLDLDYTTVKAPGPGRISQAEVDIGNLVGAGDATLLATIVQDDKAHVYFEVSERDLLRYLERAGGRTGEARGKLDVGILLADGSRYEHRGLVDYADPELGASTGTLTLRAEVVNPLGMLVSGMFARIELTEEPVERFVVPEEAVQRDLGGAYLLAVNAEGVVERVPVELGPLDGRRRAIDEGLDGTESIIVNGMMRARVGVKVNAMREAGPDGSGSPE